jgi:hypothetical protein
LLVLEGEAAQEAECLSQWIAAWFATDFRMVYFSLDSLPLGLAVYIRNKGVCILETRACVMLLAVTDCKNILFINKVLLLNYDKVRTQLCYVFSSVVGTVLACCCYITSWYDRKLPVVVIEFDMEINLLDNKHDYDSESG